tara:strand:+ start:1447 stop:3126 length:1680 start_codon:yes stop_codon:yes gene_type:complete
MSNTSTRFPRAIPLTGRLSQRPTLAVNTLLITVTLYLALTQNGALWHLVRSQLPDTLGPDDLRLIAALAMILMAGNFTILALFSARPILKPALVLLLVTSVACNHFMTRYGAVIDSHMLINVMETNPREASELISPTLLGQLLLWAALPMALIWRLRITKRGAAGECARRVLWILALWAAAGLAVGLQYKEASIWLRTHSEIQKYPNPFYPVGSALKLAYRGAINQAFATGFTVIGAEAAARAPLGRPRRVVLVVGETARADHFSLNGYPRETNPRLAALTDLVNFPHVSSCGTATAMSVPCMFAQAGRTDFNRDAARETDNVLDVLQRANVNVLWRDNNTGCQGTCARVASEDLSQSDDPQHCHDGECVDEILLQRLDQVLTRETGDQLIVLHQLGSHGPGYYRRYPPSFGRFGPECRRDDAFQCATEALVNSYDNTLLYTDHVLGELVALLEQHSASHDTAMIYVSDHGESLGEHGLFLHGFPYALAPKAQTEVPMMAWLDQPMQVALNLDMECLAIKRQEAYAHDNLFSSLLGLFDVTTDVYQPDDDLFAGCRRPS